VTKEEDEAWENLENNLRLTLPGLHKNPPIDLQNDTVGMSIEVVDPCKDFS
jgi:hypothetical protein